MLKKILFVVPAFALSCSTGVKMKPVEYDHLFNDSNSKVWLVNKLLVDNAVVSSSNDYDKDLIIFHHNLNCDYIAMKDLARKSPRKGDYILDSENRTLLIEFEDEKNWNLDFVYLTEDSILLEPKSDSDIQIAIQLKPFPEL